MDFNDTPEQAASGRKPTWLAENVPTDDAFRALPPLEQAKLWQSESTTQVGPASVGHRNLVAAARQR